jgi:hypothetical protein
MAAYGLAVYAADAPKVAAPVAKAAPAPALKAAPAPADKVAPAAKKPAVEVKAVVKGKLACTKKMVKGKEVNVCMLTVSEAKGADGKALDALKGKALRVGGKGLKLAQFDGKDVEISGVVINDKRIRAESIK